MTNNLGVTKMGADNQMEKLIIENVMKELQREDVGSEPRKYVEVVKKRETLLLQCCNEAPIEVPDISGVWVPDPVNLDAIKAMKESTPARIGCTCRC